MPPCIPAHSKRVISLFFFYHKQTEKESSLLTQRHNFSPKCASNGKKSVYIHTRSTHITVLSARRRKKNWIAPLFGPLQIQMSTQKVSNKKLLKIPLAQINFITVGVPIPSNLSASGSSTIISATNNIMLWSSTMPIKFSVCKTFEWNTLEKR